MVGWITLLLVTAIASIAPRKIVRASVERFVRIAHRPIAPVAIVFALALAVGAAPTLLNRPPIPSVHDEFANLLVADTLLHRRLSNPTPPMWEHFQTVHELMHPSYASKYPPGQGIALAVGKLLGSYAIGAFGTVAVACAMVVVALRQWVSLTYAFLGGLLAAGNPLILWWGQSYWGGGVAMLGGVLLFAGAGRLIRLNDLKGNLVTGLDIGAGLAILALSRPFEGLLAAIVLGCALLLPARRSIKFPARAIARAVLILLPSLCWLGYYNFRVTGSWHELPWSAYGRQWMSTTTFVWERTPPTPVYPDDKLRQFHAWLEPGETSREMSAGYFGRLIDDAKKFFSDWCDPRAMLVLAPAILLAIWRERASRIAGIVFVGMLLLHPALSLWFRPHYFAPAVIGMLVMMALALREIVRIPKIGVALAVGLLATQWQGGISMIATTIRNDHPPGFARWALIEDLKREPGRQIVLVRYTPAEQLIFEWVYNDADIEASKIVFARSIDPQSDRELLQQFHDRTPWLLTVDGRSIHLERATAP